MMTDCEEMVYDFRLSNAGKLKDEFDRDAETFRTWLSDSNSAVDSIVASSGDPGSLEECAHRAEVNMGSMFHSKDVIYDF